MDLRDLWKRRIRTILNAAAEGETDHREISNLAAHIGADYHGRFLIELLQNAEDQAVKAGLNHSRVTIVRTAELIAFANEGAPFDENGVKDITSAGISHKNPRDAIGNKGIGFKAVFQVTQGPEIFSSGSKREGFAGVEGARFKLDLDPFRNEELVSVVREIVADLSTEGRATPRAASVGADALSSALDELRTAAPFKFPLPLSELDMERRLQEIGLPSDLAGTAQTLIVLPLNDNPATQRVVDAAIDELYSGAGTFVLFLAAIDRIEISDRCRDRVVEVVREDDPNPEILAGSSAEFSSARTHVTRSEREHRSEESAGYWIVRRRMGSEGRSADWNEERRMLLEAAQAIPGESWKEFDSACVQVAIPKPRSEDGILSPAEANGTFFIGLPTRDPTGSCVSVSAPFHGTISRTGLDLKDQPLNRILFDEAVKLFWAGIERLKLDPDIGVRRSVSLLFQLEKGALADAIEREIPVDQAEIVLSLDGKEFLRPSDLVLPEQTDEKRGFDLLATDLGEFAARGFVLADLPLMRSSRAVLEDLAGDERKLAAPASRYVERVGGKCSLLEAIAASHRHEGPEFWEAFLVWALERFETGGLQDQEILPTTGGGLAAPGSRVFLQPLAKDEADVLDDDEQVAGDIPAEVRESLRFLDETAVRVRSVDRAREFTAVARRLAPEESSGLVRRPISHALINDALAPRLQSAAERPTEQRLALSLVWQAARWIETSGEGNASRVRKDDLRVPATGDGGTWKWVPPSDVYLGPGWLDEARDEMLAKVFGKVSGRRLVSWSAFCHAIDEPDIDRDGWVRAMRTLGVHSSPRIVRVHADRRRFAPLRCVSSYTLAPMPGVECPIRDAEAYWPDYLSSIAKRRTSTCSNQSYDVKEVCWIEGLEDPESREIAFKLVLAHVDTYSTHLRTVLARRDGGGDPTEVATLWTHAVRQGAWPVVPTNTGSSAPGDSWLLSPDEMNREYAVRNLLSFVPLRYAAAAQILRAVGVCSFDDASISRLIRELQVVASKIPASTREDQRPLLSLAQELYTRLNTRCGQVASSETDDPLLLLLEHPVPLLKGRNIVAAMLAEADLVYLNDDQVRAKQIDGFSAALSIPLAARSASKALEDRLARILGDERIRRTSKTPIDTGFVQDAARSRCPLVRALDDAFPGRDVVGEMCTLYCFGRPGSRSVSPSGEEFRRTWELIQSSSVSYGRFRDGVLHRAAFDEFAREGPTLQVFDVSDVELVESCWPLFGSGCRDLLSAYARLLDQGDLGDFFADRDIGPSERDQVNAAIGRQSEHVLERLKPVLLALWLKAKPGASLEAFESRWTGSRRDRGVIELWPEIPQLEQLIDLASNTEGEHGIIEVLEAAQVSIEEWQSCRVSIGLPKVTFRSTTEAYGRISAQVFATLRVWVARDARADLSGLRAPIEGLASLECPLDSTLRPLGDEQLAQLIVGQFDEVLAGIEGVDGAAGARAALQTWSRRWPASSAEIQEGGVPRRDVVEYLDRDESARSSGAREFVSAILAVATELAAVNQEDLSAEAIRRDRRITELSSGWWANRYSVLLPLRDEIRKMAPRTADRLTDVRAFRDPTGVFDLRARLPEIQVKTGGGGSVTPVQPKVTVPGLSATSSELVAELDRGSGGRVGEALRLAAITAVDFAAMAGATRSRVPGGGGQGGGKGTSGAGGRIDSSMNEMNGLLGEAFVYELLKTQLPEFDASNWRSTNRQRYGLAEEGRDDLGYDFEYRDVSGKLTNRNSQPLCYIEVKSTGGDGSGPFPMSTAEWGVAVSCHLGARQALYLILRVANVRERPAVSDLIVDPIRLWHDGALRLTSKDLWVRVG